MADAYVQVAPNSTGSKLHTRQRVVGANTVDEQYVIALASEAVVASRVWFSTLRIPNRAIAAPTAPAVANQPLLTIWNGGTTNLVSVRRLVVEIDAPLASTVASPILRLYRTTAAGANGTVITPVQQYSVDATFNNASIAVRADHGTDNVSATTALTAGTVTNTQPLWSQTVPRMHTASGFQAVAEYNLLPNDATLMAQDPLILRPSEGMAIRLETTTALTAATWTFAVKAVLGEFTYP